MVAGQLEVVLLANMARLQADMDTAKRTVGGAMSSIEGAVSSAKNALIGLGALGLTSFFVNQVKGAIDLADELNKLSQRTGFSAESLSQWRYAAKLADVSNETLSKSVRDLNKSIAQGLAGDKEKLANFSALGITLRDTSGKVKTTEQVMLDIADAFSKTDDAQGKVEVGSKLMGRAAEEMIPLLNGGSAAIKALKDEAEKMGLTISTDFAKQSEEFNDNITRMQVSAQKLAITMGGEFVTGMSKAMTAMSNAVMQGSKLAGVIAFIQTFLTGDDRYKAQSNVIADTEKLLELETAIANAGKSPLMQNRLIVLKAEAERIRERLGLSRSYLAVLDAEEEQNKKASTAADAARAAGARIRAPGSGSAAPESVYDKLIDRIKAKTEAERIETQIGRELTEHEKFAIGIMAEAEKSKSKLTAAQKSAVEAALAEVKVLTDANALRKSEFDAAMAIAKARQDARNAEYKAGQDLVTQATEDNNARNKTAREMLDNIRFETTLLKMTAVEREQAIAMRDLERSGIREGTQAWEEYAVAIKEATGNKAALQEQADDARRLGDSIEDGIMNGFRKGKSLADIFLDELKAQFAKTVLRPIISPIAAAGNDMLGQIFKGMSGGAGGLQAAFSGTSLGSSGFGTGLAYGNMDLGGFFADGGRPPMGKASVVGERGPELFVPDSAGTIIPNGAMGGGGTTIAPVYNIRVDARSDQAAVAAGVARALRDNNKSLVEELRR